LSLFKDSLMFSFNLNTHLFVTIFAFLDETIFF